jgi:peptidoglycan hydrolase-like protein with peptidoglycan-binding domain
VALASTAVVAAAPAGAVAAGSPGGTPAAGGVTGGAVQPAAGNPAVVRVSSVSCYPSSRCSSNPHEVSVHGTLLFKGPGLKPGMIVVFPSRPNARISRTGPGSRLRSTRAGLLVTVPRAAHTGRVMVLITSTRHTGSVGPIRVVTRALHPPSTIRPSAPVGAGPVSGSPFEGQGMWIWYVSKSNGGNVASIIAQAQAAGVHTLFIKSSDGSSNYWSQFSPQLVQQLHAGGLKACAWQYVYGTNPAGEAALGAEAVANGADCLVIDAESEYEGHYAAAQTYIADLREKIGPNYPLGLATFPYVYYHESEPYSVFLGPGGAQYNAPQMYWKAIGNSVDTVYANTWIGNRVYARPIFPLGQTYENPSSSDLLRFREEAVLYGASGISFWDWQETSSSGWSALAAPLAPLTSVTPNGEWPELHSGSKGDQVLWMQEHLAAAVPAQQTTGIFDAATAANLKSFQSARGIAASGVASPPTWEALLALTPVAVDWTGGGPKG